jgi:hypothetical protein
MSSRKPIIIYVPGMKPKPATREHRAVLWRCLLDGIRRSDPELAAEMSGQEQALELIAWTHLFYDEKKDLSIDMPGVERMLRMKGPEDRDIREANHWHKRIGKLIYLLSDAFPVLIDLVVDPEVKATLRETSRYFRNHDNVGSRIRRMLDDALSNAWSDGRRIILLAHSLGSVIAFDVLWEMSRRQSDVRIDRFVTIGSPLGLNFFQHRLLNAHEPPETRFPDNIRRWDNLSSVGEMTALDRVFADDFKSMLDRGLVESITDHTDLVNYFRGPDGLNVHKCYGYMANEKTGAVIADCWRGER